MWVISSSASASTTALKMTGSAPPRAGLIDLLDAERIIRPERVLEIAGAEARQLRGARQEIEAIHVLGREPRAEGGAKPNQDDDERAQHGAIRRAGSAVAQNVLDWRGIHGSRVARGAPLREGAG